MSSLLEAGATAKAVLSTLAVVGIQGSVLVLLALAITRAGRLRPAWQAAIWLVVLVKFALPWGPAMPWSIADLFALLRGDEVISNAPIEVLLAAAPASAPSVWPAIGWLALASVWAAGSLYFASRAIAATVRAQRAAARATPAPYAALVAELAARVGVRAPRVVLGETAHVVGLFRPTIVVPAVLEGELLRAALLHELAHLKRKDAIARVVQLVATSVFFFWPLVHLANRKLDLAREAACDVWALETSALPRPAYARLLVEQARLAHGPVLALAGSRRSSLEARVDAILAPAHPQRRTGLVHALALVAWIALSLGGARSATAAAPPVCSYSDRMAQSLRTLHPEADRDGDGTVSRVEACEFQAELRKRVTVDDELVSRLPISEQEWLAEPLCCNCSTSEGQPSTSSTSTQTCTLEGTP